jgi:hypothetical protein
MLLGVTIVLIVMLWEYWETGFTAFIPDKITRDGFGVPCRLSGTNLALHPPFVMDLLTEWARSACRDADRSTHPPH